MPEDPRVQFWTTKNVLSMLERTTDLWYRRELNAVNLAVHEVWNTFRSDQDGDGFG